MKIKIFSSIFLLLCGINCFPQKVINLYEGQAPGSENWTQTEREMVIPGINISLIQNVTQPTLRIYEPPSGKANGTAIIVAPGGGFEPIVEGGHRVGLMKRDVPVDSWINHFEDWMANLDYLK